MSGREKVPNLLISQQILHIYHCFSYFRDAQPIPICNMFRDSEVCDQLKMHQVLIITTAAEIYFFIPTLASIEIKWDWF